MWTALLRVSPEPTKFADVFGPAARAGHLKMWSKTPAEQALNAAYESARATLPGQKTVAALRDDAFRRFDAQGLPDPGQRLVQETFSDHLANDFAQVSGIVKRVQLPDGATM